MKSFLPLIILPCALLAQEESQQASSDKAPELASNKGSVFSRPNARVMTLSTPGVRGSILDRNGKPLAVSKVSWYPALQFEHFKENDREKVIAWAKVRIDRANEIWGVNWEPDYEEIWQHYRFRRWMVMPYTFFVVDEDLKKKTEGKLIDGLVLHPIYQRYYPNGKTAAHLIGYTGIEGELEKGPINYGDPIFPYTHGKAGLEMLFDTQLTGKRGLTRIQYASDGTKFPEEVIQSPTIGGNVITTINLDWQKQAEAILKQKSKRGAMVVIDVQTGEILVMASQPSFNPNLFVPRALAKDYDALVKDKDTPLFSRAFQAAYPPASTYKLMVALSGLQNHHIDRNTTVNCPAYIQVGKHKFWDWSKKEKGDLNVVQAITISNNTFFFKLGNSLKSSTFMDTARSFGFGLKTGLPLVGESAGSMPDDAWMKKYHNRKMNIGDHYNNSIGQGVLLATPLQVAQAVAAIANGEYLPKLQLIRQVQDAKGKVMAANKPESRSPLGIDPEHIATVKEGMMQAVSSGTARAGSLSYATTCGKTGTGQWKDFPDESKNQYIAWFTGFFPLEEPKYAFVVLYEGDQGEQISGGRIAAPIVKAFFEPLKKEIEDDIAPPARAVVVDDSAANSGDATQDDEGDIPLAIIDSSKSHRR
jgi:penicillin-binding protein 2